MTIKNREFKVSKSGEVFYTEDNQLLVIESIEAYDKMVAEELKLATTYFEITVKGTFYKVQLCNTTFVMNILSLITDMETRMKEQMRFITERTSANIC